MKVKSLKELEVYIYSRVVMPLKNLEAPHLNLKSPLSMRGHAVDLHVQRRDIDYSQYRRDYQRRIARNSQPYIIYLNTPTYRVTPIAEYNPRGHSVVIYRRSLDDIQNSSVLLGKLEEAFKTNTPFTKVVVTNESGGL